VFAQAVSGGADLDAKIAQFEEDIDGELLKMLEQRITAASKASLCRLVCSKLSYACMCI